MHKSSSFLLMFSLLVLLTLLGGTAVTGCAEKTDMTKQEEQSFKGNGKMPPEAAAAIAKQREAAKSKMGGEGAPPESVQGIPK